MNTRLVEIPVNMDLGGIFTYSRDHKLAWLTLFHSFLVTTSEESKFMWSARSQSRLEGWTALHCNHSLAKNEVWVAREIINSASLTLSLVYKSWTWEDWNSVFLRGLVIGIIKLIYTRTDHPRKTLLLHSDTIYGLSCYKSFNIFHHLYSAASHVRWWRS